MRYERPVLECDAFGGADQCGRWGVPSSAELGYFLVDQLESSDGSTLEYGWVHTDHTALVLAGGDLNAAPPAGIGQFINPQCSAAETGAAAVVVELLQPWLSSKSAATGMLLTGPSGVGKRNAARMAADQLGLHCIEFSAQV